MRMCIHFFINNLYLHLSMIILVEISTMGMEAMMEE